MKEKPTYYSVIPASVRYDEDLKPNEKLLYSEITALTNKNGECYATNSYFSGLYKVHKNTISLWIQNLKNKNYIDVSFVYKDGTKELEKRVIKIEGIPINKKINTYQLNHVGGINENIEENNTRINNIKENIKKKDFIPPTLKEVEEYIKSKNLNINSKTFYEYFNVSNWVDGKGNKVRNWKQKLITWNSYNKKQEIIPDWYKKENKKKEYEFSEEDKKRFGIT